MKDNKEGQGTVKSRRLVTVDYDRYAHYLDSADLTEEQKREFLQALWQIIVQFVSMGFGDHPVQQAQKACGKIDEPIENALIFDQNIVELENSILNEKFKNVSAPGTGTEMEGVEK